MIRESRDDWVRLSPLLDEALDLPPAEREAWLARQRERDPVVAGKLADLLARDPRLDPDGFLGEDQRPALEQLSSLAGQTLGHWRLERPLGRGGMGSVWLARRSDRRFEGTAAIKFLSLAVAGPSGEARFRREGSVLARLTHPNIARLLDAGVSPAGQPYLVLEYVEGLPLDTWCDQRRLSVEGRLRLFQQVLDAVAHAHANFIVHRDLKPANILVTEGGTVKLLDFGIAKLLEQGDESSGSLTRTNEAVLTFEYAAPEQVSGEPITTGTDVYSLGVVLYQLLAGRHPTGGECHTPAEQVVAIVSTDPGPLSRAITPSADQPREAAEQLARARDASLERLRRIFAGDLDNILAKALKKRPGERYLTVVEFAEDLRRYLNHEPVTARPDSLAYRTGKFVRRNRIPVVAATLVMLLLIVAAVTTALQAREARRQRDDAVRATLRADGVMQFQSQLISQVGDRPMTMRQIVDRGVAMFDHRQGGDPGSEAEVIQSLAGIYAALGDRAVARALLVRAESLASAAGQLDPLLQVQCRAAVLLAEMGQPDSARSEMQTFERTRATGARLDPRTSAACLDARATRLVSEGEIDSGITVWRQAMGILEAEQLSRTGGYVNILGRMGVELLGQNRIREAIAANRMGLAVIDSMGEAGTYHEIHTLNDLSFALLAVGEVAEAQLVAERAGAAQDASPAPDYALAFATNHASLTFLMGWPDSALVWSERAIALVAQTPSRSRHRRALFGRGRAEVSLGRLADARRTLGEMRARRDSAAPTREEYYLRGWIERAVGNLPAADSALTIVVKLDGYVPGVPATDPRARQVLLVAADVAIRSNDPERGLGLARAAREMAMVDSLADFRSMYVGEARVIEARGQLARGDTAGALASLTRALPALRIGAGAGHPETVAAEGLLAELSH